MHSVSALYKALLAAEGHEKEVRLDIGGVEYGQGQLVSAPRITGGLFSRPGIGGCAARQLEAEILPLGPIPRQAEIRVFVRLRLGEQVSEWIPKGVFFISARRRDRRTGSLSLTACDAMLKAERVWLDESHAGATWPMAQAAAVADIAARMGVLVDGRTVLSQSFPVDYPADETGELTMREVLGHIAVSNAGNWTITDGGALRLVPLGDIPAETDYLVTGQGAPLTFGGDRILV